MSLCAWFTTLWRTLRAFRHGPDPEHWLEDHWW